MFRYLSTLTLALAAAGLLVAIPAKAEKVIVYREGQIVNPQEVADVLGKTRSIRLLDDAPAAPASAPAAASAPASASASAKPTLVASASKPKPSARPAAPAAAARPEQAAHSEQAARAEHAARPAAVAHEDPSSEAPAALSLPVQFGFGSAEILPIARTQLDALAEGIKLLAPGSIIMIEGHTDAAGSPAYNLQLSRVRANAVRDYLVNHHDIDAARLKTVGYGKERPIEGSDPNAAVNRRVQFRGA
ncbi:OmpA family protein [Variovorax sp. dw_308]|uniref:OmpA family protein n=1 Tax=Variovorax sp. dw_308 TaxID=2721546 RepID=UPI001C43BF29|nr:OmpA family protein [Variovorax sp. dw_308]